MPPWGRATKARAARPAIPARWRRRWAPASAFSARWRTISLAGLPPRHPRDRRAFPLDAAVRRCTHGALPDPGDADGQRTMNTFLGACVTFGEADVDEALVAAPRSPTWRAICSIRPKRSGLPARRAAAHAAGRQVALSLSDPFCVDRHRAAFRELVKQDVDILFANEAEMTSLYETDVRGGGRGGAARGGAGCADPQRGRQRDHPRARRR